MDYKLLKEKLFDISILLMFMLPLFQSKLRLTCIALFFLSVILCYTKQKVEFNPKRIIINGSIYLIIALSIIYSDNSEYALKKLETMSSLFVFPIIFSILPSSKIQRLYENRNRYMFVYVIAIVVLNLGFFIYHFGHYKSTLLTHFVEVTRIAQGPYNIHPIYLSMHIGVAIIFTFFLLKKASKQKTIILLLADIILIAFLWLLLKKGPIIGLGIAFFVFVFLQKNRQLWIMFFSFLLISIITILCVPKLKFKFAELSEIENINTGELTSTNIRFSIYHSAIKVFKKGPILGQGIGDYRDELIKAYEEDSKVLFEGEYNSHNQYLSFLISLGLIGFIVFIFILSYNFIIALKYKNQELILLLVFYSFVMSFENILEREDGVLFFSFFVGVFSLFSYNKESRSLLERNKKVIDN